MNMQKNAMYNWKHDPQRKLIYLGRPETGASRGWHQFALADDPSRKVWCEVLDKDLHMIERVLPDSYVTITKGMRGYFAVLMVRVKGEQIHGPWNSGCGSYDTAEEAHGEAKAWAEAEQVPFIP